MKKSALMIVALVAFAALAGCNTMQGLGKDVERLGEKVQDASKK